AVVWSENVCGNSIVDPGEDCDGGGTNGTPGSCCTVGCQFRTSGDVCRPVAGDCDFAETCDGTSPQCPADALQPPTTVCRVATGPCDVAESCTGASAACRADGFVASGVACPDDLNYCTNDECDGSGACVHLSAPAPTCAVPATTGASLKVIL